MTVGLSKARTLVSVNYNLGWHPKSRRDFHTKQWKHSFLAHNGTKWDTHKNSRPVNANIDLFPPPLPIQFHITSMLALSLLLLLKYIILKQLMFTVKTTRIQAFHCSEIQEQEKSDLFFTNLSQSTDLRFFCNINFRFEKHLAIMRT